MRKITTGCSAALFALISAVTQAQQWPFPQDIPKASSVNIGVASDRPVDISRFLLARGARAGTLNNDGTVLAYISNVTGVFQLWVTDAKGGQAKQLTFGNGITFYRWHPNGKQLLYGADNEGNEREAYYLISVDGQEEKVVLPHSNAFRAFGDFDLSGERFSYASTERNGRDFDLYMYDLKTSSNTMIYQAEFGFFPDKWHPDGKHLLVTETRGEDAQNLYLLNSGSGKMKTLFKPEIAAAYDNFNWKQNGSGFYFTSNQRDQMLEVQYYDLNKNTHSTLVSSPHDLEDLSLCNNDKNLVWTQNDKGFESLFVADSQGKNAQQIPLPKGVYDVSCGLSDTVMVRHSGPASPGTIYTLSLDTMTTVPLLYPQMAGIDAKYLVTPEPITFEARDGVTIHGLLYMPKVKGNKKPPVVVDIHGGPTAQAKATWIPLTQYLVGKGIAVLDINVRGSTGYGKDYARLDNQKKRLDSVRDLVDALKWMQQDGRVDAERAAAMGGSYGGYMVNAVMGAYPDAFKAGASFVGVADWVRALQTASPGLKASDRIEYGDIREKSWQEFYAVNSPINTVKNIKAPMFYQHGVNDPRDPVTESDEMVKALRENNVPVTYLRHPDEGHSVKKMHNRVAFYRELAKFLESHL